MAPLDMSSLIYFNKDDTECGTNLYELIDHTETLRKRKEFRNIQSLETKGQVQVVKDY